MNALADKEIVLGVSGGIAAYKSAVLCSQLVQQGAGVTVVMTANARRFVGEITFSTLTGRAVHTDLWSSSSEFNPCHISLSRRANLVVVAPATANIIAKMFGGICDDLLSTLLCSAGSDVLLAPAMNPRMWQNPITQRNIEGLRQMGCHIAGPASGRVACGDEGPGRMAEPEDILQRIVELLS